MRARGFMPRKSIDKYLRVTIITTAGIDNDNDFVYSLKLRLNPEAFSLELC